MKNKLDREKQLVAKHTTNQKWNTEFFTFSPSN